MGSQFQVNTYTPGTQNNARIAIADNGNFVVVWEDELLANSFRGQIFSADCLRQGSEFRGSNPTAGSSIDNLSIDMDQRGHFIVTWDENRFDMDPDTEGYSIQAQMYEEDAISIGNQFRVNTYDTSGQRASKVAIRPGASVGDSPPPGGQPNIAKVEGETAFVVVWASYGSSGTDTDGFSVQGQRFDATGTPIGGEFQVNTYTTSFQYAPDVAMNANGNFIVTWSNRGLSELNIQGQRYLADGTPLGGEFQINTYTSNAQRFPVVAETGNGEFVVIWESRGSDGTDTDGLSIQGQRFGGPLPVDLQQFVVE